MITITTRHYTDTELFTLACSMTVALNHYRKEMCDCRYTCGDCKYKSACRDLESTVHFITDLSGKRNHPK